MVAKAGNRFSGWRRRQPPRATPSLKQWARLYRAASRVPGMDLPRLQRLARRLYQKPLAELSLLEDGGFDRRAEGRRARRDRRATCA